MVVGCNFITEMQESEFQVLSAVLMQDPGMRFLMARRASERQFLACAAGHQKKLVPDRSKQPSSFRHLGQREEQYVFPISCPATERARQRKWINRRATVRYQCAPATVGKVFAGAHEDFFRVWCWMCPRWRRLVAETAPCQVVSTSPSKLPARQPKARFSGPRRSCRRTAWRRMDDRSGIPPTGPTRNRRAAQLTCPH